jgi:NAD(P)-dependent dehydrogenase (short-subunit alcohol dehydrogenase family)
MRGPEDDAGLAGKVAIISGGGAAGDGIGNGRAAAVLLARAGTHVLVADRDLKLAEHTVDTASFHRAPPRRRPRALSSERSARPDPW